MLQIHFCPYREIQSKCKKTFEKPGFCFAKAWTNILILEKYKIFIAYVFFALQKRNASKMYAKMYFCNAPKTKKNTVRLRAVKRSTKPKFCFRRKSFLIWFSKWNIKLHFIIMGFLLFFQCKLLFCENKNLLGFDAIKKWTFVFLWKI